MPNLTNLILLLLLTELAVPLVSGKPTSNEESSTGEDSENEEGMFSNIWSWLWYVIISIIILIIGLIICICCSTGILPVACCASICCCFAVEECCCED